MPSAAACGPMRANVCCGPVATNASFAPGIVNGGLHGLERLEQRLLGDDVVRVELDGVGQRLRVAELVRLDGAGEEALGVGEVRRVVERRDARR